MDHCSLLYMGWATLGEVAWSIKQNLLGFLCEVGGELAQGD